MTLPNPALFALSDEDKRSDSRTLSVWANDLISPVRARRFLGDRASVYRQAYYLDVDDIRRVHLRQEIDLPDYPLDVIWEPHDDPDAQGHAGITGLMRPPDLPESKKKYKRLRIKLAELARVQGLTDA